MTLSRRAFLASTATVATAAAVATPTEVADAAPPSRPLRRATFAHQVGRSMTAASAGRRTRIQLRHVRDVIGQPGSEDGFILEFSSPRHLPDGMYTISSRAAGTHHLFMSAVHAPAQRRYAVVVNRTHG
jgi:hypothetical protein